MAKTAILAVRIISDATKAAKGFQQAETSTAKFERRLGTTTKVAGLATGALGLLALKARSQASALQQSSGAVDAVFGKQAASIKKLSKQAGDSLGLARSDYQQMAAVFGSQLKNMGVAQAALVPQTDKLLKLGGDLAATYGGSTADAVAALGSLLRGERDPIEEYGVGIKQADINARLAAKGQDKLTGAQRKAAETEATLFLLNKQTAAAQGQRAREYNTDAAQAERATAKLKNAGAKLGTTLLPVFTKASTYAANLAGFVENNSKTTLRLVGVVGALAAAVFVINGAYKAYQATLAAVEVIKKLSVITTAAQTAGQYALGTAWLVGRVAALAYATSIRLITAAMKANPIGLIITALTVVGGLLVLAYKKSDTFRGIVQAAGRAGAAALGWIVSKASSVISWFGKLGPAASKAKDIGVKAFKLYITPITLVIDAVKKLIGWIGKIKFPKVPKAISKLGGLLGGGGERDRPHAPGGTVPAQGRGGPGGGGFFTPTGGSVSAGNVYIEVNGALDPVAVAKQIQQLLARQGVRVGVA